MKIVVTRWTNTKPWPPQPPSFNGEMWRLWICGAVIFLPFVFVHQFLVLRLFYFGWTNWCAFFHSHWTDLKTNSRLLFLRFSGEKVEGGTSNIRVEQKMTLKKNYWNNSLGNGNGNCAKWRNENEWQFRIRKRRGKKNFDPKSIHKW